MIKVSVMYPNTPGARFDHTYYRDKHMPLVKARLGDACKYYTVDSFQAGFGPHAQEIMADIPNYTDIPLVIQISEVVVGLPGSR